MNATKNCAEPLRLRCLSRCASREQTALLQGEPFLIQTRTRFRSSHPCAQKTTQVGRTRTNAFSPLIDNEIAKGSQSVLARKFGQLPSQKYYGVSLLIRVDQLP